MKNVLFIFLSILSGNILHAQDLVVEPTKIEEKQIGVNITDFFLTFLSFNNPPSNPNPSILILYKKNKNGKRKRYGFGGRISWFKQSDSDVFFNSRANINFGREFVRKIGRKWKAYVGYETILSGTYSEVKFENFDNERVKDFSRSASVGWKGLVGLEYHLNDHLSLLTETSYGISFNYQLNKSENNFRKRTESYSIGTFYIPPTSLILSYYF